MGNVRSRLRLYPLAVATLLLTLPATAAPWKWDAGFTPDSSETLKAIHRQIHGSTAITSQDLGVPVKDVTFAAETFSIHMEEGYLYVEPEIEGYPVGAFFEGLHKRGIWILPNSKDTLTSSSSCDSGQSNA